MYKVLALYLLIGIAYANCQPSFNLSKEGKTIQDFAHGRLNFDEQMKLLPNSYWDSISKKDVLKIYDSVIKTFNSTFFKEKDVVENTFEISKISSTIKKSNTYFKIIRLNNKLTIKKNRGNIYLSDFKTYLDWNLIKYFEYTDKLESDILVYSEDLLLAFWKPNSKKWNYMHYNDNFNYYLFGLKTSKEIIQLYFDEIFIPTKQPWGKEELDLFYEIYNENRNSGAYDGLDFDKYCKCKIKFEEKLDEEFEEIPIEFYESETYFELIRKCKIYSKK